jgi:RNA polymerase sigma factor (sigma-70 family)
MSEDASTVFVVDDDESVGRALGRLLRGAGYVVEVYTSAEAFIDCTQPEGPVCAVVDLAMPGMDGLELQARLADENREIGVVFLTGHGDIPASVKAMKQGAVDFLIKPVDESNLLQAIEVALNRQQQIIANRRKSAVLRCRFDSLSGREREVLQLVVDGLLNKQIAAELGISEKTVKVHRSRVMHKTGARTAAELAHLFVAANTDTNANDI